MFPFKYIPLIYDNNGLITHRGMVEKFFIWDVTMTKYESLFYLIFKSWAWFTPLLSQFHPSLTWLISRDKILVWKQNQDYYFSAATSMSRQAMSSSVCLDKSCTPIGIYLSGTVGAKRPLLTLYTFQKVLLHLSLNGLMVLWTISHCHSRTF